MQPSSIFLREYTKIIAATDITDQDLGFQIAFPRFGEELIIKLLDETLAILKKLSLIYYLQSDLYIVGDLHGNIRDLIRIIREINFFNNDSRILFLGDYVDRGEFSIEVVTLLFSLICQYPNRIYLLRGNHEFSSINMTCGFKEQIRRVYNNDDLWLKFNTVFNCLPLCAIVEDNVFCIHGGISPHINSVYQIEMMQRPILTFQDSSLLADLMWSDPSSGVSFFMESERGYGCLFGLDAIVEFCRNQKMERVIRSHQCVKKGIELSLHDKVVTVFSCSNYCDVCNNEAGFIKLSKRGEIEQFKLMPLEILTRDKALFVDFIRKSEDEDTEKVDENHAQNLTLLPSNCNNSFDMSRRRRVQTKRKSSFSQSFSKQLHIPLVAMHVTSNEMFFRKKRQAAKKNRSSQVLKIEQNDKETVGEVKSEVKSNIPSLPKSENVPPFRKSNIPPLPALYTNDTSNNNNNDEEEKV